MKIIGVLIENGPASKDELQEKFNLDAGTLRASILTIKDYLEKRDIGDLILKSDTYAIKLKSFSSLYVLKCLCDTFKDERDKRPYLILSIMLDAKDYITSDQLSASLFLSPRQISKELVKVREILRKYNLKIKVVPHHGMYIEGDEADKRLCLARVFSELPTKDGSDALTNERMQIIRGILLDVFDINDFVITDLVFENLVVHIYIAILRIRNNNNITDITTIFETDEKLEIIANEIARRIEAQFGVSFVKSELQYLVIHLQAKQNLFEDRINSIPFEVYGLVNDFLSHIDDNYKTKLCEDIRLSMTLALHFKPLLARVNYGFNLQNPLLEKIKTEFIYEFELAEFGARYLETRIGKMISNDEIGYIALDIKMSLDNRFPKNKSKVLVICSTGRGTAELLRSDFKAHFGHYTSSIDVSSCFELKKINLDDYDYIFTTVPIDLQTKVPVVRISSFINEDDIGRISGLLNKEMPEEEMGYFPKELFMGLQDFKDKEQALEKMVEHIAKYRNVPADFLDHVLKREELATTTFGNDVAMPHPIRPLTKETFACVAINSIPLNWQDDHSVRVIALISIEDTSNNDLKVFYAQMSKLVKSKKNIERLIASPTYNTLIEIFVD